MTRVYLATSRAGLTRLHETGVAPAGAERFVASGDDEDSEYAALMAAAAASAASAPDDGRRVVVVAELPGADDPIAIFDVVAVHCDTEDRDTDDRPADADPDDDLAWFGTQEIPDLI